MNELMRTPIILGDLTLATNLFLDLGQIEMLRRIHIRGMERVLCFRRDGCHGWPWARRWFVSVF